MKKLFFLAILSILNYSLFCQNQDWIPFPQDQKTFFSQNDSIYLHYNDSTEIVEGLNHHFFGINYLYEDFDSCESIWEDQLISWGYQVPEIFKAYSTENYYFEVYQNDTLPFFHKSMPGESWTLHIPGQSSYNKIVIECSGIELKEILGFEDQVKTFEIQAFLDDQLVPSVFDNITFELAKTIGFIKYIPLHQLLNPPATLELIEIAGFEAESQTYGFTSSFDDYFGHFQVGDIYKWKNHNIQLLYELYVESKSWWRDSITAVQYQENAVSISFDRTIITYEQTQGPDPSNDTTLINHFGLTQSYQLGNFDYFFGKNYGVEYTQANWVSSYSTEGEGAIFYELAPLKKDSNNTITFRYESEAFIEKNNCTFDLLTDNASWYSSNELLAGVGPNYDYVFSGYNEYGHYFQEEAELIGYTKNGSSIGNVDPVTSSKKLDKQHLNIKVFPNPAKDILWLNLPNNIHQFNWVIFNSLGMKIKSGLEQDPNSEIEVGQLPSGIYFIQIQNEQYQGLKKWIKG